MKLTDDKRAELVEWTKICGGYRMPDMVVELLESEQAAWQEVDRLKDTLNKLSSLTEDRYKKLQLFEELRADAVQLREENEQLKEKSDQAFKIMMSATSDNERLRQEIERLKSQLDDAVSMLLHAKELYGLEMWGETLRYEEVKLEQAIQRIKGEGTSGV